MAEAKGFSPQTLFRPSDYDPESLLDRETVCAWLGIGDRTLTRLTVTGELESVATTNRLRRFKVKDVSAYIEARSSKVQQAKNADAGKRAIDRLRTKRRG